LASTPQPAQDCTEKERLHSAYRIAVGDYTRSFDITQAVSGTTHSREYERLRSYVESARLKAEEARMALESHIAEHGC
jgi:hypothetical protein